MQRRFATFLAVVIASAHVAQASAATPRCESPLPTVAFATTKIDGIPRRNHPPGKRVALPGSVAVALRRVDCRRLGKQKDWQSGKFTTGPGGASQPYVERGLIIRLKAPAGRFLFLEFIDLFTAHMVVPVMFDPQTQSVTRRPPVLDIHAGAISLACCLEPPPFHSLDQHDRFVAFTDVDGDDVPELVFERYLHNGNAYNADEHVYFGIGADLSLHVVFALESQWVLTMDDEARIERRISRMAPRLLRVDVIERPAAGRARKIGYAILRSPGPLRPLRVEKQVALDPDFRGSLVYWSAKTANDIVVHRWTKPKD